ncbi:ABC transporter substrate-binding protein [Nonomuraea bangladeshensis]|uniref:ABC transporter substrate-binding protein n=1 Tax=Nonomuraea bangladeshensis TaxID=404385 RepID=UPI0031D1CCFD
MPQISPRSLVPPVVLLALLATGCAAGPATDAPPARLTDRTIPTFTWATLAPVTSLDWAQSAHTSVTGMIMSTVTEPLERLSSTGELTPNLASKVSEPDDKTIVYTIREGARFSDGSPLTVEDVVWSIEHCSDPTSRTGSGVQVAGVEATGPMEVTVKLKKANPSNRAALALAVLVQQAKFAEAHAAKLGTSEAVPIGTGPYQVSEYTSERVTLTRNPHHWGAKPAPDKVVFTPITDDNSRQLALRGGSIDGGPVTNLQAGQRWRALPGVTVYSTPSLGQDYIFFDIKQPPFDDEHVRRAIAYSLDRAALAKAAFGEFAVPAQGLVPAGHLTGVAGSAEAARGFLSSLPQYGHDPAKAKEELARSGHPQGFTTTVDYISTYPWQKLVLLSLQENLKPLGITIKANTITSTQWGADFFGRKLKGMNIPVPLSPSSPDPSGLLGLLAGKENTGKGGFNVGNWTSPAVEDAVKVVNSPGPAADRWAATQRLLTEAADDVPYIPLFSENTVFALRQGFAFAEPELDIYDLGSGAWVHQVKATM